jgi:hypothetical protein
MEKVESEIDRLFKTNVFNISQRNIERNSLLKKHPAMANFAPKEYKFENTNETQKAQLIDKITQRKRI